MVEHTSFPLLKRGFTLVELLLVIVLIGMLATGVIVLINPLSQIQKANDAKIKSDFLGIQKAMEAFYQDYGKYPLTSGAPSYSIMSPGPEGETVVTWGTAWTPYMNILPKDPSFPTRKYVYNTGSDRQSYYIYARLDKGSMTLSNFPSGGSCGPKACNYGVSSPNVNP
jgi:general secretion pathway protein G